MMQLVFGPGVLFHSVIGHYQFLKKEKLAKAILTKFSVSQADGKASPMPTAIAGRICNNNIPVLCDLFSDTCSCPGQLRQTMHQRN